jgi:hypothetical protein
MDRRFHIKVSGPQGTREVAVPDGKRMPVLKLCALVTLAVWKHRFWRWRNGYGWTD